MSQSTNLVFDGGNIPASCGQSDWAETNPLAESYIKNKPNIANGRIHKFTRRSGTIEGETPQYNYWLADMEKRDPNDPNEYARVSMEDLYEIVTSGEIPVFLLQDGVNNSWTHYYLSRADFTKSGDVITYTSCYFVRDELYGLATYKELVHFVSGNAPYSSQYLEFGETPIPVQLLSTDGDGEDVTVTFSAASAVANIASGEKLSVALGKIAKWFSSGFPMKNYGTKTIVTLNTNVDNNGYTKLVNPNSVGVVNIVIMNPATEGELPNVEIDLDNSESSGNTSVTVLLYSGGSYTTLHNTTNTTPIVASGKIMHISAHGMGWLGTTLDT